MFCDVKACGVPGSKGHTGGQRNSTDKKKKKVQNVNSPAVTHQPMMTSVGETLLWSSYMFLANSMSTATCHQIKHTYIYSIYSVTYSIVYFFLKFNSKL